jgi:OTT_1508-like deaminase
LESKGDETVADGIHLDRLLFPYILELVNLTKPQIEVPSAHYKGPDSAEFQWLQICTWLAHLLSRHHKKSEEITAVSHKFIKDHSLSFVYTKNKKSLSRPDSAAQRDLEAALRKGSAVGVEQFLGEMGHYIGKHCPSYHQDRSKDILGLAPTVVRHVQSMISHGEDCLVDVPQDLLNGQDKQVLSISQMSKKSPLEVIALLLLKAIDLAYICADNIDIPSLSELLSIAHLLSYCSFYHRVSRNINLAVSRSFGQELWETLRELGLFYTGANLFHHAMQGNDYKPVRSKLTIVGIDLQPPKALPTIVKNHHGSLTLSKKIPNSPKKDKLTLKDGAPSPVDFHEILKDHAQTHGARVPGYRRDWLMQYPRLDEWPDINLAAQCLHCEVKMGLHILSKSNTAVNVAIGVSKNPCFLCEAWFEGLKVGGFMFHLEPSHKKVYPGWQLPGVHEADSYVIEKVWKHVDRMIQEVPHAERKDFVPALMATPSFSRLSESVLKEFAEKQIDF